MKKTLVSAIALIASGVAYAAPAPYPLTVNSQAQTAPPLTAYRAAESVYRVTFTDAATPSDLTNSVPWMAWSTNALASVVSTGAYSVVNSASGIVDFTFSPASLNYTPGRYVYEVGIRTSGGVPRVYRQGAFTIYGSPYSGGAAAVTWTQNADWSLIAWNNAPTITVNGQAGSIKTNTAWTVSGLSASATNGFVTAPGVTGIVTAAISNMPPSGVSATDVTNIAHSIVTAATNALPAQPTGVPYWTGTNGTEFATLDPGGVPLVWQVVDTVDTNFTVLTFSADFAESTAGLKPSHGAYTNAWGGVFTEGAWVFSMPSIVGSTFAVAYYHPEESSTWASSAPWTFPISLLAVGSAQGIAYVQYLPITVTNYVTRLATTNDLVGFFSIAAFAAWQTNVLDMIQAISNDAFNAQSTADGAAGTANQAVQDANTALQLIGGVGGLEEQIAAKLDATGGTASNLTVNGTLTVPDPANETDAANARWVRGLFSGNTILYASTNVSPYTVSNFLLTTQMPVNRFHRSYTNPVVGTYLARSTSTNRYMVITSPTTVNANFSLESTASGRTIDILAELYYTYDGTNYLGDYETSAQTVSATATNLKQWVVSHPLIAATNATGFMVEQRFKVVAKNSSPNLRYHGGDGNASHIGISASVGTGDYATTAQLAEKSQIIGVSTNSTGATTNLVIVTGGLTNSYFFSQSGGGGACVFATGFTNVVQTGDDGTYRAGASYPVPRFTILSPGSATNIVRDITGLEWARNFNIGGVATNWQGALDAVAAINSASYGGKTDWRLPNAREILSIIMFAWESPCIPNTSGTGKWTAGDPFHNVQTTAFYWSSTPRSGATNTSYYANFNYPWLTPTAQSGLYRVCAVRGGTLP